MFQLRWENSVQYMKEIEDWKADADTYIMISSKGRSSVASMAFHKKAVAQSLWIPLQPANCFVPVSNAILMLR